MSAIRLFPPLFCTAVLAAALAPTRDAVAGAAEACDVVEAEYALAATLKLADTPMGKGDGVYPIGPGTLVLRFERRPGTDALATRMAAYRMRELLTIQSTTLFWTTTVVSDASSRATPDSCAAAAEGVLEGRTLRWTSPVRGYTTDGTLTCDGSLCGTFGAPPPGRSELHIPPHPARFAPFEFGVDGKTFTMGASFVSKTESPKQTAYLSLAGRETRRACVSSPRCG